jgi:hypothetical protein
VVRNNVDLRQVGVLRRPAGPENHLSRDCAIKAETRNGSRDERKEELRALTRADEHVPVQENAALSSKAEGRAMPVAVNAGGRAINVGKLERI